jgi:hypothetical protein
MPKPQQQHFVPQSYLERFGDPTDPPYLQVYTFAYNKWKRRAPKAIAFEWDFYAYIDETGRKQNIIESEYLHNLEDAAARIYGGKISNRQLLSSAERETLAQFIGVSLSRTPTFRNIWDDLETKIARQRLELLVRNPGILARVNRQMSEPLGSAEELATFIQQIEEGTSKIQGTRGRHLKLMVYSAEESCPYLSRMVWQFWHSPDPHWFITSDNPVSRRNPAIHIFGLAHPHIQIYLPLSRNVCLVACWRIQPDFESPVPTGAQYEVHLDVPTAFVSTVNALTVAWADKIVVSPTRVFAGHEVLPYKSQAARILLSNQLMQSD